MAASKWCIHSRPRAVLSRASPPQLGQKAPLAVAPRPRLPATASAIKEDKIFNRKDELAALKQQFDDGPSELVVLLGPVKKSVFDLLLQSANKRRSNLRVLKEVMEDLNAAQPSEDNASPPVLYLDCRGNNVTSPEGFANAIRELVTNDEGLQKWWEKNVKSVQGGAGAKGLELTVLFEAAPDEKKLPMTSIIDSLKKFLKATREVLIKPIIIIDEANKLQRWRGDPGNTQLKDLLDFFVQMTKQEHLAHIMLASSDSFVIDFLETEGLNADNYVVHQIGDLSTKEEAKKFLENRMLCKMAPPSFFDTTDDGEQIDMWSLVYERCGGNIGLLERCATNAKKLGSWKAGLNYVSLIPEDKVKRGLRPGAFPKSDSRSDVAWTKEDYTTVVREIALAAEFKHAVSFDKLEDMVGEAALKSLVEWNMVMVRRKSSWAKDLPETLFTELRDTRLVTMPSPVQLYYILELYEFWKLDAAPHKSNDGSLKKKSTAPLGLLEKSLARFPF